MTKQLITLTCGLALSIAGIPVAMAKSVPSHPAVHEVDQRLLNQQRRIDAGVAQGKIGAAGVAADSARDNRVARQLSSDEAAHNGHITKAEDRRLNAELDQNSADINAQRHR